MLKFEHRFAIEILTPEGLSLGQFEVPIDWEPARESVRLIHLRNGSPSAAAGEGTVRVEPVWDSAAPGEPYAVAVRLIDGEAVGEIHKDYFKPLAIEISSGLVEKKVLKAGDLYVFRILAYRETPQPPSSVGIPFTVRNTTPTVSLIESSFTELAEEGTVVEGGEAHPEDLPVLIPQSVLDEVEALTLEAGSAETGGILIGHLYKDASLPEIAVVVTAQIPARHTVSKTTKLTFTAETWTAVQAALDLRRSGEKMVGWFHSHPSFAFCNPECPPERRATCALQKPFLSGDDLLLHRAVFAKAWQVALLCNNADAGLEFALFGWRHGLVQRRGFTLLGDSGRAQERRPHLLTQPSTGELAHAPSCQK